MSTKNIKLVQSFYESVSNGDFGGASQLLDPNVEWLEPDAPDLGKAGTHHGADAVFREVIEPAYEKFDQLRLELDEFLDAGNCVVVLGSFRGRGKTTGTELNAPFAHVWKLQENKVMWFRNFTDTTNFRHALGITPAVYRN
ncbi:MAG TPA: nuclear transport factor 2 family protein [Pirellulales bacterium]|jgi:hypothetical protein|nr:nuclear transport factor 2 family protein [Pirellulales bacterium]